MDDKNLHPVQGVGGAKDSAWPAKKMKVGTFK